MRKLIVEEWISLDGYISDANEQLAFFSSMVRASYNPTDRIKFLETIDVILFGRKTYSQFASLWPERETETDILAKRINEGKKIVFSNSLVDVPWGKWPSAELMRGDAVLNIKELKSLSGNNIVLWGSISLAQACMKENLIDEYHLHLCPSLIGGGRVFFIDKIHPRKLKLLDTTRYDNGSVLLKYGTLQ